MNRRELLSGLVATLAAGGVAASAEVIEAEPAPLLLVLKSDKPLNQSQHDAIRRHYDAMRDRDSRLPLLVVLEPGMALEAVLDPRADTGRVVSAANGDRGTVFDANGNQVERCVEANLKTGRCVVWQKKAYGRLAHNARTYNRTIEMFPAPLTFTPGV
jgi:hypothetical protein